MQSAMPPTSAQSNIDRSVTQVQHHVPEGRMGRAESRPIDSLVAAPSYLSKVMSIVNVAWSGPSSFPIPNM